jgi:electron transport complex protein RnfE
MGLCAMFVLILSNITTSALRKFIPSNVRIVAYVIIIATYVTITDLFLQAFVPALSNSLGLFVPLIVVNSIILERSETFAGKNPIAASAVDGLSMGLGFMAALLLMSSAREILGAGTFAGRPVFPGDFQPALMMVMAPGGFLTLGIIIALAHWLSSRTNMR